MLNRLVRFCASSSTSNSTSSSSNCWCCIPSFSVPFIQCMPPVYWETLRFWYLPLIFRVLSTSIAFSVFFWCCFLVPAIVVVCFYLCVVYLFVCLCVCLWKFISLQFYSHEICGSAQIFKSFVAYKDFLTKYALRAVGFSSCCKTLWPILLRGIATGMTQVGIGGGGVLRGACAAKLATKIATSALALWTTLCVYVISISLRPLH